jgi:hypothetical protein
MKSELTFKNNRRTKLNQQWVEMNGTSTSLCFEAAGPFAPKLFIGDLTGSFDADIDAFKVFDIHFKRVQIQGRVQRHDKIAAKLVVGDHTGFIQVVIAKGTEDTTHLDTLVNGCYVMVVGKLVKMKARDSVGIKAHQLINLSLFDEGDEGRAAEQEELWALEVRRLKSSIYPHLHQRLERSTQ